MMPLADMKWNNEASAANLHAIDGPPKDFMIDPKLLPNVTTIHLETNRFVVLSSLWSSDVIQERFGYRHHINVQNETAPMALISLAFQRLFKPSRAVLARMKEMLVGSFSIT